MAAGQQISALAAGHAQQLSVTTTENASKLSAMQRAHGDTVANLVQQHQSKLAVVTAAHQAHVAELTAANDVASERYRKLRSAYVKAIGLGDLVSRDRIINACNTLGLDAVLLTNIVFRPVDAKDNTPFRAQIDHLVLTETGILVVENKYWKGLTFHTASHRGQYPALDHLLGDIDTTDGSSQAIALVPQSGSEGGDSASQHLIKVSIRPAPAEQVRRQAIRLREYAHTNGIELPWVDTCVFYSHSESHVIHPQYDNQTTIVSDSGGLESCLRATFQKVPPKTGVPINTLIKALAPLGPDIEGLGSFANQWESPLTSVGKHPRLASRKIGKPQPS
ncbi:nuclease-related domain-containing protein [Gordonia terrae]